jgi:carbon monoxide dehydrogenase subunit G
MHRKENIMGSIEVNYEMVVSASPEDVYAYLTNVDNYVELVSSAVEVRGHSGALTDGATWQSVSKFMGREVISDNQVVELKAPNLFRYESHSNAADTANSWEVEAVDGGTRVRHVAGGEVKGFFASIAMSLLKSNVDKQFNSDMERLKQRFDGMEG